MDDLTAFLNARLDEDEAAAKAAADETAAGWFTGTVPLASAAFIARHDPARVLREVEAKRAILARYAEPLEGRGLGEQLQLSQEKQGLYFAVLALAAVWSDHPDYWPGWKP